MAQKILNSASTICLLLALPGLAAAHDISGLQSAVSGHLGMSQSRCAEISQEACSAVFGNCDNYDDGAVGKRDNVTISYTCLTLAGNLRVLQHNGVALEPATLQDLDRALRESLAITAPYFD